MVPGIGFGSVKNGQQCFKNNIINPRKFWTCAHRNGRSTKPSTKLLQMKRKSRVKSQELRVRRRSPARLIWYKDDPTDKKQLILRNGTRIRKGFNDAELYCTEGCKVYALTKRGLILRTIQYLKKKNYGKKTPNGVNNGQRYPYLLFRNKKYDVHVLMTLAWDRPREEGEEIDHINGNIDDCRKVNLRVVSKEENRRCAKILRRLRKLAKERHDRSLNPKYISQKRLLEIFEAEDPIACVLAA